MQFHPDPTKQANEVIFSQKISSNNLSHPPIKFDKIEISEKTYQKHLGILLDSKLSFNAHIDQKIKKCNIIIGLIRRFLTTLPQNAFQFFFYMSPNQQLPKDPITIFLKFVIKYIKETARFDKRLFCSNQ